MTINLLIYYLTFGPSELAQRQSSLRQCLEELDELPLIRFLLSSIRFSTGAFEILGVRISRTCPTSRSSTGLLFSVLASAPSISCPINVWINTWEIYQVANSVALGWCFVQDFPSSCWVGSRATCPVGALAWMSQWLILFWQRYLYNLAVG